MSPDPLETRPPERPPRPPISNVPTLIFGAIGLLVLLHALRAEVLGPLAGAEMLLNFAFIPGCLSALDPICGERAAGADLYTFLSYSFLHGDWVHLAANSVWLLAFGTPVVRRIGTSRFLAFCAAGSIAGAGAFYLVNPALIAPVIGASGVVSALMGAACRFAFGSGGALAIRSGRGWHPLLPIARTFMNRTVVVFVLAFFATNLLVGSGAGGAFGAGQVAWEAHLGGFAFGFLGFALFDRRPPMGREERL